MMNLSKNEMQARIHEACILQMSRSEEDYRANLIRLGLKRCTGGVYRARLFGALFPLHAYASLGAEYLGPAEQVFLLVQKTASRGCFLFPGSGRRIAEDMLRQLFEALLAEWNNVGAGQYALSALYLNTLAESFPSRLRSSMQWPPEITEVLGKVTGENLAVWASWCEKLSGRPMQVYTEGFKPGLKDIAPL